MPAERKEPGDGSARPAPLGTARARPRAHTLAQRSVSSLLKTSLGDKSRHCSLKRSVSPCSRVRMAGFQEDDVNVNVIQT